MAKRIPIPEEIRNIVFELYAKECGLCGEAEPKKLQIHHLDENATNNEIENLFLCCYLCHAYEFHPDRADEIVEWWEQKFEEQT